MMIEGDESSFIAGVSLVIQNKYIIDKITKTMTEKGAPKKERIFSGYWRVHIFTSDSTEVPKVTLLINDQDMA